MALAETPSETPTASPESVDWLQRLIAFPTVSRDSNIALIEAVRDYLSDRGVETRLTFDDDRRKANLWATLGPEADGGIVLSGHTDVVPVEDQDWSHDPFDMVTRDGKAFGRGTADMKGFIAAVLAAVPRLQERGLEKPVHLAFKLRRGGRVPGRPPADPTTCAATSRSGRPPASSASRR